MNLLQCVDYLLLSGLTEREVAGTTNSLLNFLGSQGLRVKSQFVEEEVNYLGDLISKGK
jgi:hypothetical protein